jgi:hypothetical protein
MALGREIAAIEGAKAGTSRRAARRGVIARRGCPCYLSGMRPLRFALLLAALVAPALAPRPALADPPAKAPPKPKKPEAPALPAPQVTLDVELPAQGTLATMRLKNTGEAPLRVVTDARLLRITVPAPKPEGPLPRGKKPETTVQCAVPAQDRPKGDGEAKVLGPGKTYVQRFDLRTLCFSEQATRALAAATRISAAYGFEGKGLEAPFAVGPVDPTDAESKPAIANAKEVRMAERDLGAHTSLEPAKAPTSAPGTAADPRADDASAPAPPRLSLAATPRIDTNDELSASLSVTLKNESSRGVALAFRTTALVVDVLSPSGQRSTCSVPGLTSLGRDLVPVVGAGRASSLAVVIGRFCPAGTFDERGVYTLTSRIDTRKTTVTAPFPGLFSGVVVATAPTLLRMRAGAPPRTPELRPVIE